MDIVSIFRSSGPIKQNKSGNTFIIKLNNLFKDKVGVGVGFILSIVIAYIVITLFTIYNLLVSL
ncbi:MAG: hypothetical protein ABFR75_14055 [Acidobacteriota bacterium]